MKAPLGRNWGPSALVFALLVIVSSVPHLRATLAPPEGTRFVGVFYSIPDVYNYFSYMQQAEDGSFFLSNKLSLEPHRPAFVNLEWWAVGRVSGLTGMGLPNAFRLLGIVATFFLVLGVDHWLERSGLPATHQLGALLLVFFGGGLGGIMFLRLGPPAWRFVDLTAGVYPFISILVNPHFVTGTALLVWALIFLNQGPSRSLVGVLFGNVLGLSRPYDMVLLVGTRAITVALTEPHGRRLRAVLPLLGLFPAVAINYSVLYGSPAFRMLSRFKYQISDLASVGLALAPALALASLGIRSSLKAAAVARQYRVALVAWAITALLSVFILSIPLPYMTQAVVDIGLPLLSLGALGLAGRSPRPLMLVALLFSSTGFIAFKLLLEDNPSWFVPRERLEIGLALRRSCRPGEVVMAPPEIGMYANAYSACRAFITHVVAPDAPERHEEMTHFYLGTNTAERQSLLDRRCVSHVVLPGHQDEDAIAFLGTGSGFRRTAEVGSGPTALALYSRNLSASCAAFRGMP